MPDLLTHYAVSLLIASRVLKLRYAAIAALAGLLPDVDALLRIHRAGTHSLLLTAVAAAIILGTAKLLRKKQILKIGALLTTLYALHITMDILTAPTPILWPASNEAYMATININAIITAHKVSTAPIINIIKTQETMKPKPLIEGPITSKTGIIAAVATTVVLITEYLTKRKCK